jgi:glycosyltransferase involved in cell wall biosynthesis
LVVQRGESELVKALEQTADLRETAHPSQGGKKSSVFLMNQNFRTGGTERQFAVLVQALTASGRFEVGSGCLEKAGAFLNGLGDVPEFRVGGSFLSWQAQRSRWALGRYLRKRRFDVAHSFDFYSNLMLIPTARMAGVPVVIGSKRNLGHQLTPVKRKLLNAFYRWCDKVVCNSHAAARLLADEGLPEKHLTVIPNGLPEEAFSNPAPALPSRPGVLRVGLIARMNEPVKNQSLFLRSAARLAPAFPEAEFVLVGDGALRGELEALAEQLGLGKQARFLGERGDVTAVLAALDVSVVASRSESLSNVILESMAAGKPVVATNVGGNAELVREGATGLLVPPDDVERFAEAIGGLLRNRAQREEFGARAKSLAHSHYRMERVCEQYEELYARLLAEKARGEKKQVKVFGAAAAGEPLRVALVAPSLRALGGQSVQASLLLRQWKSDAALQVRFVPTDPEFPRGLRWAEKIPAFRTMVRMPFYLADLWKIIRDADVVHIFSASYWSFLLAPAPAWLVARLLKKKTVLNYRSGEARDHLQNWRTARWFLSRMDELVVPSGYLVEVFREFGLQARVVPNIVDMSQFAFRLRDPLRPILVCTRNFEPYYSVDVVIRAFAQVQAQYSEARLHLIGSGKLEDDLRALVRELNLKNVEFPGAVKREEIGRYYDQADIFINASWLDNMPVSILEAFAAGTPVVSTGPEGIRHIVEHERTGLLSSPGDWQALAQNVVRLLRAPELAAQLARAAHAESLQYHWEVVREKWLDVYRGLIPARANRSQHEPVVSGRSAIEGVK